MKKEIIDIAKIKLKKILNRLDNVNIIIIDNWRGNRFIFDINNNCDYCNYGCTRCPIYKLLKKEKQAIFSANLLLASEKDRIIFGPNIFLNIKTFKEYQNCYANFIATKANSIKEIESELRLLLNLNIIYSKNMVDLTKLEWRFKKDTLAKSIRMSENYKKKIIIDFINRNKHRYLFLN